MRNVRVYVRDIREGDWIKFPKEKSEGYFGRVLRKLELPGRDMYELVITMTGNEYVGRFSGDRMLSMRIE